jgi:hypothetical protein
VWPAASFEQSASKKVRCHARSLLQIDACTVGAPHGKGLGAQAAGHHRNRSGNRRRDEHLDE